MISTVEKTNGKANGQPAPRKWLNEAFEHFSRKVTAWSGSSWAFVIATATVAVWGITGPYFHYSDTWQLVINTGTTIVTFLMVFLIQRAQNKDSLAIQIKLNELLASQRGASNRLINVEDWSEDDIAALHQRFTTLSERLNCAATDCESHSITEAKDAADEAQETLAQAENRAAQAKQERESTR